MGIDLLAEPQQVRGFGVRLVRLVHRLVPRHEPHTGIGVDIRLRTLIPGGQLVDINGLVVAGPPDLFVGGGDDLAEHVAGDHASDGGMGVEGEAALWFDGGEVLDLVSGAAAQVLPAKWIESSATRR